MPADPYPLGLDPGPDPGPDPDAVIGAAVRAALGARLPWIAVQTTFSPLHGTVTPARWGAALAALAGGAVGSAPDRRGANHPAFGAAVSLAARACAAALAADPPAPPAASASTPPAAVGPPWAALADVADLTGLPACLDAWGRRLAVGAVLPLTDAPKAVAPVLVLAPDQGAYARLCRLLSWHHEDTIGWQAWVGGLSAASPSWEGLVALVQDATWSTRLRALGAETLWRLPGPLPPPGVASAAVPILTDIGGGGARAARILHLIQDKSQVRAQVEAVRARVDALALAALPRVMAEVPGEAIDRGHELASRCAYAPGATGADGQPSWHMPPGRWPAPEAELAQRCARGLVQRYGGPPTPEVRARLDYELGVVSRKGFASYILTVAGIVGGRRTCGRGSGASSLICYLLGITNVDPVRYRLVFERFLSDERLDPPDIDVDFPWDERDDVLAAVIADYGREHVAMIATHQTLRADGALREAGRALGRAREDITNAQERMSHAERHGIGVGAGADWDEVLAGAAEIEGMVRGLGLHCGGVVITPEPLRELVPVHPAAKAVAGSHLPAIAWEKDGAEEMGLVKIDLLGNRSLAVVRDVVADLREDGIAVDEWRWAPDDDLLAHRMIAEGRTIGCFYIESPAMRLLMSRCGSVDFDQLVLLSSIVRPAAHRWIGTYLERLHEFRRTGVQQDAWYPHPALRGLLSDSFGVLSYQEDVMLVARELAGFGCRDQNRLRKALGRADTPQRLASLARAFHEGCAARGVSLEATTKVWAMILSFAGYSFCKAHSASYAMVSFACACLKAHNPAHFLARVIHNCGGFYSRTAYVEEARRAGVTILPPCVARGFPDTRREGHGAIRLGFELIKGLRQAVQERIVCERARLPWRGVRDFWRRVRPARAELVTLHDSGALTALAPARGAGERDWLVAAIGAESRGANPDEAQQRIDAEPEGIHDPAPPLGLRAPSQRALDARAWAVLGCLPRAHPFALWELPPRRLRLRDIGAHLVGRTVTVLAWQITRKQVAAVQERDRDGEPLPEPISRAMAFVTLEDDSGLVESTWFPDCYRACGALLDSGRPLWVQARVAVDHGVASVEVMRAWGMQEALPAPAGASLRA